MKQIIRRYTPHLIVFVSSMGIMIIELVASRLVAKFFGNSLYTWTGVIGIVLGGISLGNWIGGKLADRFRPDRVAAALLAIASVLTLLILVIDVVLDRTIVMAGAVPTLSLVVRSVAIIALLFLLPASALGTISPVMAKYALLEREAIGRTVGNIYAISSIGSIVGTFFAGFVLIPLLDVRIIVAIVAAAVAVTALLLRGRSRFAVAAGAAVALLALVLDHPVVGAESGGTVRYSRFSEYSYIRVKDMGQPGGPVRERDLIMDGLVHNRMDPSDPNRLLYDYERIYLAATRIEAHERATAVEGAVAARTSGAPAAPSIAARNTTAGARAGATGARSSAPPSPDASAALHTLTLGGGALTFPSYLARHFATAENTVVEIDPRVISVAYRYFDVPTNAGPRVVNADARVFVNSLPQRPRYDLIFLDAFNSFSVPAHLTTVEFTRHLASIIEPDGLLLANTIDVLKLGGFLSAYYRTLRAVFPHVAIYADPSMEPDARATFVFAASLDHALPDVLMDEQGRRIATALGAPTIEQALAHNAIGPLTDYYAPVDNLMAPVFLSAVK